MRIIYSVHCIAHNVTLVTDESIYALQNKIKTDDNYGVVFCNNNGVKDVFSKLSR